ncbi:hypothetical protein BTO06_03925 [Tenacibaculum sp. SZ-18]|nr:hypothetical protein BTO06_03925 [Tenacibaculum sp. SZ-18]
MENIKVKNSQFVDIHYSEILNEFFIKFEHNQQVPESYEPFWSTQFAKFISFKSDLDLRFSSGPISLKKLNFFLENFLGKSPSVSSIVVKHYNVFNS